MSVAGKRGSNPRTADHGDWVNRRYLSILVTFEVQRTISADHPSLPGHFPGTPIVPAVVILDEISAAMTEWQRDCQITEITTMKFLAPLKPDQKFVISLSRENQNAPEIDVTCRTENEVIVRGRLLVRGRRI